MICVYFKNTPFLWFVAKKINFVIKGKKHSISLGGEKNPLYIIKWVSKHYLSEERYIILFYMIIMDVHLIISKISCPAKFYFKEVKNHDCFTFNASSHNADHHKDFNGGNSICDNFGFSFLYWKWIFFSECPNYAQGSNTLFYCIYLTLACILWRRLI